MNAPSSDDLHRLPRTARPTRYDLLLEPDLEHATFSGEVAISVDVEQPTDILVLNAAELSIDEATVSGDAPRSCSVELDEDVERLVVTLPEPAVPGPLTLRLRFRGVLNDKLRGWYRSTFRDDDGREQVIATSQMQATDCRRAFPCWDEPEHKAVFAVTMRVSEGLLAISNGPEISREGEGTGTVTVRFADTMPMSSYLVAFVVGPLEATAPVDVDGVPMRVVHVPGKGHLTGFALEVGAFALRWFQRYYGIPYPSDKVDLVALPDFAAGAMENLGCITFRESVLLVDPASATQAEEQLVADVVAHELAHMWFGDLVTMRWWNGIWLNEAFATFMEVAACDAFRPAWKRWESFSLERTAAFDTDSLLSTRPVEFEVVSPEDADGMFDVLTYQKGGALLRMLEQYLGEDGFRDGIRHYLGKHSYGNTETSDLWDALEATSAEPVRRIMDSWIWQEGYPLVSASISADGEALLLRQRRFVFTDPGGEQDDDDRARRGTETRWAIPIQVSQSLPSGESHESKVLLDADETSVALLDPDAVVVVNCGGHGFYRVAYDTTLRERLTGAAQSLSTVERYALVDDAWAAVVAGEASAPDFCALAEGFAAEPDVAVWRTLVSGLGWCDRLLDGDARDRFRAFVRDLVGPRLEALGWRAEPDEDELTGELRGLLIRALAILGDDAAAQQRAAELFERQLEDASANDPEVAAAVVNVVATTGGPDRYDRFVDCFRTAPTPQEKLRYLYALADFRDEALMARTLEFLVGDEVKTQNAPFVLGRCIANRDRGEQAWRFVREQWDHANAAFPDNSIVRMIDPVKTLIREDQQADVAAFFAEHEIPQAAKTLQQVLERQRINVALREREAAPLSTYFGA
ncbi:MAG TPA: M1 family metallopeptidase [Nocardioidaceae bacterium]